MLRSSECMLVAIISQMTKEQAESRCWLMTACTELVAGMGKSSRYRVQGLAKVP